jgi:transposase
MINYIGIDISKRDFHACFTEQGGVLEFNNDTIGISKFIKTLKHNKYIPKNTLIGLESTGSYHLPVAYLCTQAGYEVNVINPLITKKQNQTNLRRVKTDKQDARLIRHCLINGAGYLFTETADSLAFKALVRHRARYSMLRVRMRLRHEEMQHRQSYLKIPMTTINHELFEFLDEKIKILDVELRTHSPKAQKLLQTIPGVGPQTAATLLAEVGDIARFPDSSKLTAWIGLDPRVHQSGTSINGKGYITKRGNKLLRTRLFNAASVAVIHPPNIFHTFFEKKRSEGKPYRVALCAVMHKMVHVIYAVWTRETPFVNELTS